nr:cornifelin-like isoform X2 [Doryrhamphus excisus]
MASQPLVDWENGLCDCFYSANTCCFGFWCCPCLACTVAGKHGENRCLPLCDIFSPALCTALGIPFFVPPAALSLRTSIRRTYGIKGSLCKDIAVSCFCMWCSWCQMHRELKERNKTTPVLNVPQTFPVVQQPPQMMTEQTSPPAYYVPHQLQYK